MGLGLNAAGLAAGYQGFAAAQRQSADDDRRAKEAERADKDAAFQEEQRTRQRTDWSEQDRIKAEDKQDLDTVNNQFATPATIAATAANADAVQKAFAVPKDLLAGPTAAPAKDAVVVDDGTPAWAKQAPTAPAADINGATTPIAMGLAASGMPKPQNFNHTLDKMAARLQLKSDRGTLTPEAYAQGTEFINRVKKQGVAEALELMAQGRYDEALEKYNSTGSMNGARVVDGKEGVTKINGQDTPTHYVTIANADGSHSVMDVARARYQLLDINSQLNHADNARKTDMQATQHADQIKLGYKQLDQQAKDAAASRALQVQSMKLQIAQYNASTPLGQIQALGAARGKALSTEEIENKLGLSKIPRAVEMQVQSLLKESDTEAQAIAKAIASPEGLNPTANETFAKNAAIRNEKLNQLLTPYSGSGRAPQTSADPLNLNGPKGVTTVPNPLATTAAPGAAAVGGVRAVLTPDASARIGQVATAPAALPAGAIDVRADPVLTALRNSITRLDPQNAANVPHIMTLGKTRAARLEQLQQNYGPHAQLIAD